MEPQFNAVHNFNSGSGNVLLPDGTKPLPEPTLTYRQRGSLEFIPL